MLTPRILNLDLAGRNLSIETGKLAQQASAAVTVQYGGAVVLVTVTIAEQAREGTDFLPLTVDYEERLYAAGKIPGGFIRREGRPTEEATLASRLTDRAIRPLLPKEWRRDIQVIITVLSADQENDPDMLALIGSSTVLSMSEIPFAGPVGTVRVGYINNNLVLNPTLAQLDESLIDLVVASTREKVVMIEMGAKEAPEDLVYRAIEFGHEANQAIIRLQEEMAQALGKPKETAPASPANTEVIQAVARLVDDKLPEALAASDNKAQRDAALARLRDELLERMKDTYNEAELLAAFDARIKRTIRTSILEKKQRVSGRGVTQIRPLSCQVGLLPRTHGSALFTRGQTQVLTITTLGSLRKEQQLEGLGIEESKRFMHHYNFPPFSTGEVKRLGSPGRREIGHGALAERALLPVLPKEDVFPYTIRLVSEVLSSSGSTSMGSVCASSMSLMDAGVPIRKHVAGIAMGLVTDDQGNFVVLTDIEGIEDAYGDMDFKVAGTRDGITAVQMDTKLKGLTLEIVKQTITQAREARLFIMDVMQQTISEPRPELSKFAPRIYKVMIDPDKIGTVIGSGGKVIRAIQEQTKSTIDIDNDGTVLIEAPNEIAGQRTVDIVQGLTREIEVGTVYTGKVTRVLNFGAMVEILPGKEGLVHISELADYRVGSVEDIVKVGDEITVKVIEIDNLGRVNLSRRAVLEKTPRVPVPRPRELREGRPPRPRREGHPSGPRRPRSE